MRLRPVCYLNRLWHRPLVLTLSLMSGLGMANYSHAVESFQINFDDEPQTLGDIKPAFLSFEQEPLPAIPIREVIRRYKQLFESTQEPEVRIDALHRMTSLEAKFGDARERTPEEERKLYQMALESYEKMASGSYEMIVGAGVYYKRIDELLYQTAKANDLTGQHDKALRSLEQLVGLYPNSHLATEAWFRIGEAYFSNGNYDKSVRAYSQVLSKGKDTHFEDKARYMLGWAYYKQGKSEKSADTFVAVLDGLAAKAKAEGQAIDELSGNDKETLEDTVRVLCLSFSYDAGASALERLLQRSGEKDYAWLLYDRLAKLYLKQQRFEDGADTARSYIARYPDSPKSPRMAVFIIDAYQQARFLVRVQEEKELFVSTYVASNPARAGWAAADKMLVNKSLESYLRELSRYYFLQAQQASGTEPSNADAIKNYSRAGDYYVSLEAVAPRGEDIGRIRFLAGEAFFNAGRYQDAVQAYERSAYQSDPHKDAANAGYAAIMAYGHLLGEASQGESVVFAQKKSSILAYAKQFADEERAPVLLSHLSGELMQMQNYPESVNIAEKVVIHPKSTEDLKRTAWLTIGQAAFALQQYVKAEKAYSESAALMKAEHSMLPATRERIAAAIYRQAEDAIASRRMPEAIEHFLRIEKQVPESSIVPNANFDAASRLMELQDWPRAIVELERFEKQFPTNELAKSIPEKLVYAYLQSNQKVKAADALVRLSKSASDTEKSRNAIYQAAELYETSGDVSSAMSLYREYTERYPEPFDLYVEAHNKLAEYYAASSSSGDKEATVAHEFWLNKIITLDQKAGSHTTERAHFLAGQASLVLANKQLEPFMSIKLGLPLKKSLKRKRSALEAAVKGYNEVLKYGYADLSTEATFKLGEIYRQLSADLLASERPKGLDELELEQYGILLEEQAYPYEEKAIELYEINATRTKDGVYDKWVQESFRQLSKMVPANYKRQQKAIRYVSEFK